MKHQIQSPRQDLKEAVERAMNYLSKFGKGIVILWEDYDKIVEFPHGSSAWKQVYKKVQRQMRLVRKVVCHTVPGIGFELLTDSKAARIVPTRRSRRAARQFGRGLSETAAINLGKLNSDTERLALVRSMDSMRTEKNRANQTAREATKPKIQETIPVRKEPVLQKD